jgi:hypothetical protein
MAFYRSGPGELKADGLGATEIAKRLKIGRASDYRVVSAENGAMERVFIGATRVEATRKRMMGIQKARAEVAAGGKGSDIGPA